MNPLMKYVKIQFRGTPIRVLLVSFTLLVGVFAAPHLQAQTSTTPTTHYRNFEVKVDGWTQEEVNELRQSLPDGVMKVQATCAKNEKLLLAVDASYPKRIEDIQAEIMTKLKGVFAPDRIHEIETLSHQKTVNYCK